MKTTHILAMVLSFIVAFCFFSTPIRFVLARPNTSMNALSSRLSTTIIQSNGGYSVHEIEWIFEGHIENYMALGAEDWAQDKLKERIITDTTADLQTRMDELGNPLTVQTVEVELIDWQLSEGSDVGIWDTDYKVTATVMGNFLNPEPILAIGGISMVIIAIFINALPMIIKAVLVILVIFTITYLVQNIRDLFVRREHIIYYDEEGNIIQEEDREIPLWEPWEVPLMVVFGGGVAVAIIYMLTRKQKPQKKRK